MKKWHLTKILVIAAAGLALAAGTVAAVAATRAGGDQPQRAAGQEETNDNEQPWLGVLVRPSDEPSGLAVRHVAPDSPAADAGLERGDVITAIDGQAMSEFEDLADAIDAKVVGDNVTLSVIKNGVEEPDGKASEVQATLEARPEREEMFGDIGKGAGALFDRFVDGTFRYLDEDGNTVTVEVVAGTISTISDTEITLDVNGDEVERSFDIPDGVEVPEGLAAGDRAAVVIKGGALERVLPGGFPFPLPGLVPDVLPGSDGGFKLPFDGEGNAVSVEVISGTVVSVGADEITLEISGDQGEKPFSIPDDEEVPAGLEAGEQATVVVQDGKVVKIVEGGLPNDGEFRFPFDGEAPFPAPEPRGAAPEA